MNYKKIISVNEKLPDTHREYLVYTGNWAQYAVCYYNGNGQWVETGTAPIEVGRPYEDWSAYVTHWIDFPKPPEDL